jgi:hypothetical protein
MYCWLQTHGPRQVVFPARPHAPLLHPYMSPISLMVLVPAPVQANLEGVVQSNSLQFFGTEYFWLFMQ